MDIEASPTSTDASEVTQMSQPIEQKAGLVPSHGITIEDNDEHPSELTKPPLLKHVSTPAYTSPLRHHRRTPSTPKHVKESLNARSQYVTSQDDGVAEHKINQYIIKQEIGRGSFGAVHLAVDQYGTEYAVKEFSKARLRKRAQSHILRKPLSQRRRGALQGFNSPLHRHASGESQSDDPLNSIALIKEEIAIMKKLNHPNLVSLIEVLDDPTEDSLYMVMEMCKKGVVMTVGLEMRADPYPDDQCRYWFRDLLLGIEYLHAQGVVHRDIKPDNCLVTEDDVLKIVDFGVSEMFEKNSEMRTTKSAGSPAFLPPELCVARHGDVSGKAADIWSMGVTLYCLKYGRIPFEKAGIFELYESIKDDTPDLGSESDDDFRDLMYRILEKDPTKRIKMQELRAHPWVTKRGTDQLLSEKENTADLVDPPTEAEMEAAITSNMRNLLTVVKAVNKFKSLTANKRPPVMSSILGEQGAISHPPAAIQHQAQIPHLGPKSQSWNIHDRDRREGALVAEGVHRDYSAQQIAMPKPGPSIETSRLEIPDRSTRAISDPPKLPTELSTDSEDGLAKIHMAGEGEPIDPDKLPPFRSRRIMHTADDIGTKGHAHDPLEDQLYLRIGPSTFAGPSASNYRQGSFVPDEDDVPIVSESPGAADVDIYETAYRDEIERILAKAKQDEKEPNVYLNRRVDERLMAISALAGRWAAGAEEARNQIDDYTQFRARKAKVTEVSKALRAAAKDEYEKRKQEKREAIARAKIEKATWAEEGGVETPIMDVQSTNPVAIDSSATTTSPPSKTPTAWKDKAVDKGRQARSSLLGLVDMVKQKTAKKDEAI